MCMLKIAVIGGKDTVIGFKAVGLEACPASTVEEARQALRDLTKEGSDYAIIYIEEKLAQSLQHEIDRFKDSPAPAIILIPGREGSMGLGRQALRDAVERAVGTNILGD
ncbi:MAG: V-type ATP synthase subunit F [Oscillospiraceae bacterium]|nr:V-type ATP synthase subunit F [Oscillospiraceae bacterium]